MLVGCSAGDDLTTVLQSKESGKYTLDIDVVETDWDGETISATTRAGETMESLRGANGFGLYCAELSYANKQVTWDNATGKWVIGENDYNEYWRIGDTRTLNIYAYAPYKKLNTSVTPPIDPYTVAGSKLTFNAELHSHPSYSEYHTWLSGNNVDLLYASETGYERKSDTPAALNFNHALAKLTFGTITNNTGETLYLNGFTISSRDGNLWKQAKLDLSSGDWSEHVAAEYDKIVYPPPFVTVVRSDEDRPDPPTISVVIPPLPDKRTITPPMSSRELLVIPDANGKITLNIKVNSSKETEQFSFPVILEKGKNKTYNITVQKNFEVVIEE